MRGLRRLGKVLHVTKTKRAIVRAELVPPLYSKVFDDKLRKIGWVYDIIGSVNSPYVSVELVKENCHSLVGKTLYVKLEGGGRLKKKHVVKG